jgi:hypothetical protein
VTLTAWLERHTAAAPPALRGRVHDHVQAVLSARPAPLVLAAAASRALDSVVTHPGDRSIALDLLAADALITLALLAQAEDGPAELDEFATSLLKVSRPGT